MSGEGEAAGSPAAGPSKRGDEYEDDETKNEQCGETYGGDGAGVKGAVTRRINSQQPQTDATYYLRSSLLDGRVVTAYNSQGVRRASYVWAGGQVLAQQVDVDSTQPRLRWEQMNPVTGDGRETGVAGTLTAATHLDAFGVDVGESNPFVSGQAGDPTIGLGPSEPAIRRRIAMIIDGYYNMRCRVDGIVISCVVAHNELARDGGAVPQRQLRADPGHISGQKRPDDIPRVCRRLSGVCAVARRLRRERTMAEAVFQLRRDQGLLLTGVHQLPGNANDAWANSLYWDTYLDQACSPQHEVNK